MFTLLPQDKANHELYGARIAAVAAIVACLVAELLLGVFGTPIMPPVGFALLLSGSSAIVVAAAVAFIKEFLDSRANEAAEKAGLPAPHSVEVDDALATVRGGVSVGLPLLCTWALYYL